MHVRAMMVLVMAGGAFAQEAAPPPPPPVVELTPLRSHRGVERFEYTDVDVPGFHVVTAPRRGLLVGSAIAFGVSYLLSAYIGLVVINAQTFQGGWLFLPVLGPFVAAGIQPSTTNPLGSLAIGIFAGLGVLQAAGIAGAILAIRLPYRWLERDPLLPVAWSLQVGPQGVGVSGVF